MLAWLSVWSEVGADLHIAQLMPLPLTVSCSSKIQIAFTFLVPEKGPLNECVCVCVCACVRACVRACVLARARARQMHVVLTARLQKVIEIICCCLCTLISVNCVS